MCTEKRVSESKVIPIVKMLKHLASRQCASITHPIASNFVNNINTNLQEKFAGLEKVTSLTLATLLDPQFKEVGFCSMTNCQAAVERLTRECASVIPAPATATCRGSISYPKQQPLGPPGQPCGCTTCIKLYCQCNCRGPEVKYFYSVFCFHLLLK